MQSQLPFFFFFFVLAAVSVFVFENGAGGGLLGSGWAELLL